MKTAAFSDWLHSLSQPEREAVAKRHGELAFADGAYVLTADHRRIPIPPVFMPAVWSEAEQQALSKDARVLLDALSRLTEWLMTDDTQAPLRERLFATFTPLERMGVERTWRSALHLATARVDFLVDVHGNAKALEMNSTIPAMQGYSDAIASGFLRSVGEARGLAGAQIEKLVTDNGRNADDLLASLLAHYTRLGGTAPFVRIAIVAREQDSQTGELDHYVRRWRSFGHDVQIAAPSRIRRGRRAPEVDGNEVDLIYRHIFARRLETDAPFSQMLLEPELNFIFNPMSTHLELKAMLGLLSAAVAPEGPGRSVDFDDEQRQTVQRVVPWTRVLLRDSATLPDGAAVADLADHVGKNARDFVLKRSWDYGGRGVFLGADIDSDSTQARLRALFKTEEPVTWQALVDFAAADGELWIAQELVHAKPTTMPVYLDGAWQVNALYADVSAYTNRGVAAQPAGGAVRASASRIVNIQGGGGLQPVVREAVLAALLSSPTAV